MPWLGDVSAEVGHMCAAIPLWANSLKRFNEFAQSGSVSPRHNSAGLSKEVAGEMGAAASRQLADKLYQASNKRQDGLNVIKSAWEELLVEEQQRFLDELRLSRRRDQSWRNCMKKTTPVTLDENIASLIPQWKREPQSFFSQISVGDIFDGDYAFALYSYLRRLGLQEALNTVQHRVALVALHGLRQAYGRQPDDTYFIKHIAQLSRQTERPEDETIVRSQWLDLARRGGHYASLAADLSGKLGTGIDVLLVLPADIPPSK